LPEPDLDEVARACEAVTEANPMPAARLRVTYTGGRSPLGSERRDEGTARGAVVTVPWTRNERGALSGLKTTSYGENVVALARAREQGATEALFGNTRARRGEGTGS